MKAAYRDAPSDRELLIVALMTTGNMVSLCLRFKSAEGDALAVVYAQQGVRAARLLGLYSEAA